MVIPGHGRLSDEQDVIEYRDMATIVRDRIREYVKRGMTLEQVKAKKPTLDFDPRYGTDTGFWTTSMFVETIYKEMVAGESAGAGQAAASANAAIRRRGAGNEGARVCDGGAAIARGDGVSPDRDGCRRRAAAAATRVPQRRAVAAAVAAAADRDAPARRSISPAPGCRSSPRTGSGG